MAVGLSSAGVGVAACLLSLAAASLGAATPPACDFQAECRPGETYRLAIPCDGKCSSYIQCQDGVAAEKRCGKFFWHQNEFDPTTLDCVRSADCDWWRKVPASTTTAGPTAAPTTTTSAAPAETTAAASSTETTPAAEPSTSAASAETTTQPTTPSAASSTAPPPTPEPEPSPAESGAARLAAVGPTLLAAALVLGL